MGEFSYWAYRVILLCCGWQLIFADYSNYQRRSMEYDASSLGKVAYFLLYVAINEYGKKLDNNYLCPTYCEVDHIHSFQLVKEQENKKGKKKLDSYSFFDYFLYYVALRETL
jgi:hypothetical protein